MHRVIHIAFEILFDAAVNKKLTNILHWFLFLQKKLSLSLNMKYNLIQMNFTAGFAFVASVKLHFFIKFFRFAAPNSSMAMMNICSSCLAEEKKLSLSFWQSCLQKVLLLPEKNPRSSANQSYLEEVCKNLSNTDQFFFNWSVYFVFFFRKILSASFETIWSLDKKCEASDLPSLMSGISQFSLSSKYLLQSA